MDIKISEIREAINEAWMDFKNDMGQSTSKPYEAKDQWEDEIKIFMNGLKSGDFIEFGDKSIGVEWRQGSNSNDPRFIVFEFGDRRLRDDHFSMQHSRSLTDDELKDIRDVMVRMGMVDKYEFDMEYNLNMGQFYESRVDRAIRKVISEAMYKKVPEDGNFPASKGRRPKSTEARISQLKHAANEHGLSKRTYNDGKCKAVQYYGSLFKSKGYDVNWTSTENDERTRKYNFVLSADDGMKLEGYIKCRASGSDEKPFSEYDTIMVIEPKEKRNYNESIVHLITDKVIRRINEDLQYDGIGEDDSELKEWAYNAAMDLANRTDKWLISPISCGEQSTEGCDGYALKDEFGNGQEVCIDCDFYLDATYYESRDDFSEPETYVSNIYVTTDGDMGYAKFKLDEDDPLYDTLYEKIGFSLDNLEDCQHYSSSDEDQLSREEHELDRFEEMRDEY